MKELSIIISVTPLANMKQSSYTFIADQFDLSCSIEKTSSGNCFNCDNDITIDRPSDETLSEFRYGKKVIVHFRDSSGEIIDIGTKEIPALLTIIPNLNTAIFNITCRMLRHPFLS